MKNSLRFYAQAVAYKLFDRYSTHGTIFRHGRRVPFLFGIPNQQTSRLVHLEYNDVLTKTYEQTRLIQDVGTLGFGLFFLLRFDRDLKEWMQEKGIIYEKGTLVYPSPKTARQEAREYENLLLSNQYFFGYYHKLALSKYTLSELVQKIRANFPLHQFGFDFLLFEELCLAHPDLFSKDRKTPYLLPAEEELIREWLLSKGLSKKKQLNKHISKCTQKGDNFQRTVSLFQKKLSNSPQGLVLHYLRLHAKHPQGLTAIQIKTIMTRLHGYLKKAGPVLYARKVSYDLILGLQVDLVLGLNVELADLWSKQDLLNCWLVLIDRELGMKRSDVFYTDEETRTTTPKGILSFLQNVWQRSCYLDAHIKLHVPLLNNFTTSRL